MKFLAETDERLIAMVQEVYLWLWDRTGVFVGTVAFFVLATAAFLTDATLLGRAFLALVFSVYAMLLIIQQGAGLSSFNAAARGWRRSVLRVALILADGGRLLFAIITQDWPDVPYMALIIVGFLFLPCIQIRDREPPEKHVFASEGA